jgi:4-diphosphocytidyl-2-C-methyl-D-erythritol kinase
MSPAGVTPGLRVMRNAPAKLNLTLAVVGRRDDGYHALHSVMVPLALSDVVVISPAPGGAIGEREPHDTLRIDGLALTVSPDNLVLRAISATRDALRSTWPGSEWPGPPWPGAPWPGAPQDLSAPFAARLTKRIPVAAGLGGGSSDAAATVVAVLAAWGAELPAESLRNVAAALGSDVPFFLAGGVALVTGRGENVEPLPGPVGGASGAAGAANGASDVAGGTAPASAPAVLLVTPGLPVSTAGVFAAFARVARPAVPAALSVSQRLAADLRAGLTVAAFLDRAEELAAANDLMPASDSVAPDLAGFRAALGRVVGRPVGQSGSGPTAWVLYPSLAAAQKAARFVRLGIIDGSLPPIGRGDPFIAATTLSFAAPAAPAAPSTPAAPAVPASSAVPAAAPSGASSTTPPGAGAHNDVSGQSHERG